MTVRSTLVGKEGLAHIVANLRPRDRAEIFGMRWDDDEKLLVEQINLAAGDLWRMWWVDDEPVAVNGVCPIRPGVVIAGAFGTNKWRRTIRAMTRWSLDYVIPVLVRAGYHRGEAYVLAVNTDSRRWIELLGGEVEALLKGFGRSREDYLLYAWDLTLWETRKNVLLQQPKGPKRAADGCGQLH